MNGNNHPTNSMCNFHQIPKNLPLKKRRAFIIDAPSIDVESVNNGQTESYLNSRSTARRPSFSQEDPLQIQLPSIVTPTPPSSPQLELLRQKQHAHSLVNSASNQNLYPPVNYECLMVQKVLAEQFLDDYRSHVEQRYANQQSAYPMIENKQKRTDMTIDEHFRKSLGNNYDKFTGGFLTPEDLSSNSSPIERTPVDSIDEHFARSLGRFWPLSAPSNEHQLSSITGSVVDDHFAKALGATTWERLKDKS